MNYNFRKSTIDRAWKEINSYTPKYNIVSIDIEGYNHLNTIMIEKNLVALSGLNGVGKSTIINKIIDAINQNSSKLKIKYQNNVYTMDLLPTNAKNELNLIKIDYHEANDLLSFFKQSNLEEYLEQYETSLQEGEISRVLSYLVGKEYKKIELTVIEEDDNQYPYFKVYQCNDISYDNLGMGTGEHFIFHLFFTLYNAEPGSIILIEELENFISMISQTRVMNWLVILMKQKKLSVIMVTHSYTILEHIPLDNISQISKVDINECTEIIKPKSYLSLIRSLSYQSNILLQAESNKFVILVEDKVARYYLKALMEKTPTEYSIANYKIVSANGWNSIDDLLSIKWTKYLGNIIAVFDGDIKDQKKLQENTKYPFEFLPMDLSIEHEFKDILSSNIDKFVKALDKNRTLIMSTIQKFTGEDHHDFLENFSTDLNLDLEFVIKALVDIQVDAYPGNYENFWKNLHALYKKNL